ncbi:hypothetical protein UlMin_024695 [Ulmus minor]
MSLSFICACFSVVQHVHFDLKSGRLCYEGANGAFTIVEILFSSSLLAIVGASEQPSLSPRCLCLFNTVTRTTLRELNFLTSSLAIRMNQKRYNKTYIYDIKSLTILDTIDTVPNLKGLCAFFPSLDGCFLALPASTTKGSLLLYNVMELHPQCEIDAPRSPLAAMALSSSGVYIATEYTIREFSCLNLGGALCQPGALLWTFPFSSLTTLKQICLDSSSTSDIFLPINLFIQKKVFPG